jgi:hypothetical protein
LSIDSIESFAQSGAFLLLNFVDLTASGGGIVDTGGDQSFERDPSSNARGIVSGSLVAASVSEPSTLPLFGTAAVVGLGVWARRRQSEP